MVNSFRHLMFKKQICRLLVILMVNCYLLGIYYTTICINIFSSSVICKVYRALFHPVSPSNSVISPCVLYDRHVASDHSINSIRWHLMFITHSIIVPLFQFIVPKQLIFEIQTVLRTYDVIVQYHSRSLWQCYNVTNDVTYQFSAPCFNHEL